MLRDLQWFTDREGSYIMRGTTEVFIPNEAAAKKLHEMQSDEYVFSEKKTFIDPFLDDKPAVSPTIKVYGAGEENPNVCTTGCEG